MTETGKTTQLSELPEDAWAEAVRAQANRAIDERTTPPYYGFARERQLVTWATLEWHLEDERHRVVALEKLVQELQQTWPLCLARWWSDHHYQLVALALMLILVGLGFIAGWTAARGL